MGGRTREVNKAVVAGEQYDCQPTLDDQQVIDFCRNGFLMLPGVVSEEVNRRAVKFLDGHDEEEPSAILDEQWFVDGVIKNPAGAGAVRSLLGRDFVLPKLMANHRVECPAPALNWHADGGSVPRPQCDYLQVFYYPEETPREMGPTEILPGSHLYRGFGGFLSRLRSVRDSVLTTSPAGTIFVTFYSIWHRRSASSATGIRNNLKYNYWRTVPPCRDWKTDPDFDFSWRLFETPILNLRGAELLTWLCNEEWEHLGGQSWPCPAQRKHNHDQQGLPAGLRRHPC